MSLLVDIEKDFGTFHLQVQFEAGDKTLALLGASGCGKSMTLKCIAGIETPDRGRIILNGATLFDSEKKINLPPQQRRIGLMFQNYALFPHMTVLQNIQAAARREKDKTRRTQVTSDVITRFGLSELGNRFPHQLSGGQQQRVALARILVSDPEILLLDEPFSALDTHLRFQMEQEVREVIRSFGKSVILVSHDRDEVFRMADSIAIMGHGIVETVGEKHAIFSDPGTRNGAVLTGCKNISPILPVNATTVLATDWGIKLKTPSLPNGVTHVGIRMRQILPGEGENSFRCRVVEEIEGPFSHTIMLHPIGAEGKSLGWLLDKPVWPHNRAEEVQIHIPPENILLLRDQ